MKCFALAGLLLGILCVVATTPADARRACPRGGYCPAGTCAEWDKGNWACDVKNCSAAHCRR